MTPGPGASPARGHCFMIENSVIAPLSESGPAPTTAAVEIASYGVNRLTVEVRHGRRLVVKRLKEEYAQLEPYRELMRKEYALAIKLRHPAIVSMLYLEHDADGAPQILMEFVEGVSLSAWIDTRPPRSQRHELAVVLADALAYMHSQGVSHRDLKPDNILVNSQGQPVIIDLGLGDSNDFVTLKQSAATPSFGAPEQKALMQADSRADVYSFGLIMKLLKLPQRRLINRCLRVDPRERPKMAVVLATLRSGSKPLLRRVGLLIAAVAGAIAIIYLFPARHRQETTTRPHSDTTTTAPRQQPSPVAERPADTAPAAKPATAARESTSNLEQIFDRYLAEIIAVSDTYWDRVVEAQPDQRQEITLNSISAKQEVCNKMKEALKANGATETDISAAEQRLWLKLSFHFNDYSRRHPLR